MPVAGEDERSPHGSINVALAPKREIGTHREVPRRRPDSGAQVRVFAIDMRRDHRKVLEVRAAVPHRLQSCPMKEAGDVLGGDPSFRAERVAPAHLVRCQKEDVAFERVGADRIQAGVAGLRGERDAKRTRGSDNCLTTSRQEEQTHEDRVFYHRDCAPAEG